MSSSPMCGRPTPVEQALADLGIRHKLIPVGTPQQNDKVERSHRTLDEECLNSRAFRKPRPRAFAIKRWVTFYNFQRPHSALHWHTPLQTLRSFQEYQRVTHVS